MFRGCCRYLSQPVNLTVQSHCLTHNSAACNVKNVPPFYPSALRPNCTQKYNNRNRRKPSSTLLKDPDKKPFSIVSLFVIAALASATRIHLISAIHRTYRQVYATCIVYRLVTVFFTERTIFCSLFSSS